MGTGKAGKDWDPLKLKAQPDPEVIKPAGMIVDVVLTLAALVLFNAFPQWVGIGIDINGKWVFASILAPAFFQYLPWIDLLWALTAALKILVVSLGRWQAATRWASIALELFNIVLAERMLTGPALIAIDPAALSGLALMLDALSNAVLRVALGITVVVQVVEVAKNLYKLLIKSHISRVVRV
jgi:hypothetical protein